MRTHGQTAPFQARSWVEIDAFLASMAGRDDRFQHMSAIVRSVLDCHAADRLAAYTSMHDLIVVAAPIPEPPYGVVVVRAPGSIRRHREGHVLIEHLSVTGHDDKISRPVAAAVPLS